MICGMKTKSPHNLCFTMVSSPLKTNSLKSETTPPCVTTHGGMRDNVSKKKWLTPIDSAPCYGPTHSIKGTTSFHVDTLSRRATLSMQRRAKCYSRHIKGGVLQYTYFGQLMKRPNNSLTCTIRAHLKQYLIDSG